MLSNRLAMTIMDFTDNGIITFDDNGEQHLISASVSVGKDLRIGDRWLVETYGKARYMLFQKIENTPKSVLKYNMIVRPSEILGREYDFVNDIINSGVDSVSLVIAENGLVHFGYKNADKYGLTVANDMSEIVRRLSQVGVRVNLLIDFNLYGSNVDYCQQNGSVVYPYIGLPGVYAVNDLINEIALHFLGAFTGIGLIGARYIADTSLTAEKIKEVKTGHEFIADYIPLLCDATGATLCIFDDDVVDDNPVMNGLGTHRDTQNTVMIGCSPSKSMAEIMYLINSNSQGSAIATRDYRDIPLLASLNVKNIFLLYSDYKNSEKTTFASLLASTRIVPNRHRSRIGFYYDGTSVVDGVSISMKRLAGIVDRVYEQTNASIQFVNSTDDIGMFDVFVLYNAINLQEKDIERINSSVSSGNTNVVIIGKTWYNNTQVMPFGNLYKQASLDGGITSKPLPYTHNDCNYGTLTLPTVVFAGVNDGVNAKAPLFITNHSTYIGIDTENITNNYEIVETLVSDIIAGSL